MFNESPENLCGSPAFSVSEHFERETKKQCEEEALETLAGGAVVGSTVESSDEAWEMIVNWIESNRHAWHRKGACTDKTIDRNLFYPPPNNEGEKNQKAQIKAAKAICAPCPVKKSCLNYALEHNERGIWGGLDGKRTETN